MAKIFEERKCIVCGNIWLVEVKKGNKTKTRPRCFCSNCATTLTPKEKQVYYRVHDGSYVLETRKCLNCGKEWIVATPKTRVNNRTRQRYFCENCSTTLTNWEKKKIMKEEIVGVSEKLYLEKRNSRLRNIQQYIWNKARQRAKKHNLEFNIDVSDIIIPEKCPIIEVPLVFGTKGNYEYSPSIDRIDTTKGYIKGNIAIISKKANSMKNNATLEELQNFCKNILRYSLNITEKECNEQQDKEPVG